jgi:hypothetical protein
VFERALSSVLAYADQGNDGLVLLTTLAEDVYFRGAVYGAVGENHLLVLSTAVYSLVTVLTRNPVLVLAAGAMGTLFSAQRRVSGGIQAPVLTQLTWSTLMLRYLPPLFAPTKLPGTATSYRPGEGGRAGPVGRLYPRRGPWSVLRATQFHEFARQLLARSRRPVVVVPRMRTRPVAAAEVAAALVEIATGPAVGFAPELAGPREHDTVDMVRQLVHARGERRLRLPLRVPGKAGQAEP